MIITSWHEHQKNTLRGFLDVQLESGLLLHGLTVHEKNGERWVGMPSRPYQGADGQQKWEQIVEIPDADRRRQFRDAVLAALDEYLAAAGQPQGQPDGDNAPNWL